MSKRNRREHGRILSVETMQRGSALDVDAAAGATSITVTDGGDFDEDGGWLYIGTQVVEFTACDDDTGIITLADPLTSAAEQGDPVAVYDPLYEEVVDYQVALVQLDGEYDNPDPVEAEVAEGVEDLPEGERGKAGESCTLKRVADDEWEIVEVGGRSRKSRGLKAEWDDTYVLTAADIAAGTATMPLTHRPANEWLIAFLAGVPQRPSNFALNYDAKTITWPLSGWEKAEDRIWVHYAYRKGLARGRSNSFNAYFDVPVTLPADAAPGDFVVIAALLASTATYTANGFSVAGQTANVTHGTTSGGSKTAHLTVFTGTLNSNLDVPTINNGSDDAPNVVAVFPAGGAAAAAGVATVADAGSASTPTVDAGKVLRVWGTIGVNQHITVPANVTTVAEHNPPRDTSALNDMQIVMTLDSDDGGTRTATTSTTAGWLMAAIPVTV